MASSLNSIAPHHFLPLAPKLSSKPKPTTSLGFSWTPTFPRSKQLGSRSRSRWLVAGAVADEVDVISVRSSDSTDHQGGGVGLTRVESDLEGEAAASTQVVGGFGDDARLSFQGFSSGPAFGEGNREVSEDVDKLVDRAINAIIVFAAGSFAIARLLTIDHDYWHGWTLYEILRYAPQHNWSAYEEALKANPVLAKMMISGIVYSLGDWIAQCYEGKPLFEFDRARLFRSGLVGFSLHGSLSHFYYQLCEALFPFQDWWVVPAKVVFDQTLWSAIWNSIYYVILGFLRLESPSCIFSELKATFLPMLTAGWKLWPFAHLITYGVIPVEQRLLWVDCVELIWVMILSTYSNEKSEARISEAAEEAHSRSTSPPQE